MPNTAVFYNRLSFAYPLIDRLLHPYKRDFIEEINRYPKGQLLEIGIGIGSHLSNIKHDITGIDFSSKMIHQARKNNPTVSSLLEMDARSLEFETASFDYILLSHVISTLEDSEAIFEEVDRVLKPTGSIFIFNHFTPNNWLKYLDMGFNPLSKLLHFRSYYPKESLTKSVTYKLDKAINFGVFAYYQLLIYQKP